MKKVSVIVPVYNAEVFLGICIESLLRQTLQDIEIICVEDGSTDSSRKILKEFRKKDKRIRIIYHDINKGGAESRNDGLSAADGKYIQFVDSDDYIQQNALENLYVMAESRNLDMCYVGLQLHPQSDIGTAGLQHSILKNYPGLYGGKELIKLFVDNKEFFLYLCSVFYRSSFIKGHNLRFKDLVVGEGGDFILRALCNADRVMVCPEKYYHYRVHANSITHGANAKKELLTGQIVQYIDVFRYFSRHEDAGELKSFLEYQYKKMAGGLQNLSDAENKEIEARLDTDFSRHIFHMLRQDSDTYGIVFHEAILQKAKEKHVIIYGAGYASKEVIGLLQRYGIEILGFAVTKRSSGKSNLYGHHIYEIQELASYKKNAVVLVASNRIYNQEIQSILERYGFEDVVFLDAEI